MSPLPPRSTLFPYTTLFRSSDGTFTDEDKQTLERFAVHAAIAIDNAHLHAQVADLAVAEERIRIAHEMHDGLAQVLGYVNRSEEHTSELQSLAYLVCRLLLE